MKKGLEGVSVPAWTAMMVSSRLVGVSKFRIEACKNGYLRRALV
jgi:hypothetical protein